MSGLGMRVWIDVSALDKEETIIEGTKCSGCGCLMNEGDHCMGCGSEDGEGVEFLPVKIKIVVSEER